jgi:hypothetical protein
MKKLLSPEQAQAVMEAASAKALAKAERKAKLAVKKAERKAKLAKRENKADERFAKSERAYERKIRGKSVILWARPKGGPVGVGNVALIAAGAAAGTAVVIGTAGFAWTLGVAAGEAVIGA